MSILSFLDTVYDTYQNSLRYKVPGTNRLVNGNYDYNTFRYPLDIGNYDKGHYMVIHINQQNKTQFSTGTTSDKPTVIQNTLETQAKRGAINFSQSQVLGNISQYLGDAISNYSSSIGSSIGKLTNENIGNQATEITGEVSKSLQSFKGEQFLRTIKRTTDSVVLYMPDTLNFQYQQVYDQLNVSAGNIAGVAAAGMSVFDDIQKNGMQINKNVISPFVLGGLDALSRPTLGDLGRAGFFAINQMVRNPMIELIYSQPQLRTFQFDFMFYPRDEKEALEVQNIIERLRFHQAPEIKSGTTGYFLIPPSEFDIKFYYNGTINPNLDKISTCVLENIIINYAPQGFTAYESANELRPSLGRTGMPVAIQMTLMFKETQILTKDNFRWDSKNKQTSFNTDLTLNTGLSPSVEKEIRDGGRIPAESFPVDLS